jgi:hypothetical protein
MFVDFRLSNIVRDKLDKPKWSEKINRWHQLDDESFAVAQATYENQDFINKPDVVFITAAGGSTHTDCLFTMSDKFSPSHFVHTLPNVRALSFSLVTNWEGPMICTSYGKESFSQTIEHAYRYMLGNEEKINAVIVNVSRNKNNLLVDLCQISKKCRYDWKIEDNTEENDSESIINNKNLYLKNILVRKVNEF